MRQLTIAALFVGFIGLLSVSCDRYEEVDRYSGEDFFRFTSLESVVSEKAPDPVSIDIVYTSADGEDASGSIEFSVEGGQEGVDYTVVNSSNTLTFNQSNTFTDQIMIQPVDNDVDSPEDIVLTIRLDNPSSGVIGFPGTQSDTMEYVHLLTIRDDDCTEIPIGGTYNSVTNGMSTDPCCPDAAVDFPSTVVVQDQGNNLYAINDFSAGLYLEWYEKYGITSQDDSPAVFELTDPVNGTIEFPPGQQEPFQTEIVASGTYDPCTGIIEYSWTNGYGDTGDVTLTPN